MEELNKDSRMIDAFLSDNIDYAGEVDADDRMLNAFLNDDIDSIKSIIDDNPSIDLQSTLSKAVRWNNLEIMKLVVEKGGDLKANEQEIFHDYIEELCGMDRHLDKLEEGETKAIEYMVSQGIDVDAHNGLSLKQCSRKGHLPLLKLLVENGGDLNRHELVSNSAVHGHVDVTMYLLEKGADKELALMLATPNVKAGMKRQEIYEKITKAASNIKSVFTSKHTQK